MPATAATPLRVPRRQSTRGAYSNHSGADDISHLSLAEVRDRLARNERVLGSSLISGSGTSPTAVVSASPFIGSPPASGAQQQRQQQQLDDDPVRDRLLAVRQALLSREAELLASSIGSMSLDANGGSSNSNGNGSSSTGAGGANGNGNGNGDPNSFLAQSPPTRSGKQRALEAIRQTEAGMPNNSISLPIQQSLALGTRDFDNVTAARLANMSLGSSKPPTNNRRRHVDDELGRAAAAAQYARAHVDDDDDDMFDTDEAYVAATVYAADRRDRGNGLSMTTVRSRREEGFDEDDGMDEDGDGDGDDDGEDFAEGNDDYEGDGRNTLEAAPPDWGGQTGTVVAEE